MATINIDYQLAQGVGIRGEPVRKTSWEVQIPHINDLTLYATECSLPKNAVEKISIHHFNGESKIAGKPQVEDVTIKVVDAIDPDMASQIQDWFYTVFNPETREMGYATDYKKMGFIRQFDSKGILVRTWQLNGMWPTEFEMEGLKYGDYEAQTISLKLSVDKAFII